MALVGGGPGDPGRSRFAVAGCLQADVVINRPARPPELLAEPPRRKIIDAAKIPYGRAMAQDAINAVLIERARSDSFVGPSQRATPSCSPRAVKKQPRIPVTVVPGVTSAIACYGGRSSLTGPRPTNSC